MAEHPYITTVDRIGLLNITVQEKAILLFLARHGNWDERDNIYVSHERLARETGLSARQVRFWLAVLRCDPREAALGLCRGGPRCYHRGLLVMLAPAAGTSPATYLMTLETMAIQQHLPEVGVPTERRQGAYSALSRVPTERMEGAY